MRYFYNSWDSAYKSHFGAIARNQSCQFTIRLPEETPLDFSPVLVVFRTGFKERFLPMNTKTAMSHTPQISFPSTPAYTTTIFPTPPTVCGTISSGAMPATAHWIREKCSS